MTHHLPHVSIVVLNWNGLQDTVRCLTSVRSITYPSYDVVVVDNHSDRDELSEIRRMFPDVHTIQNDANLGYAGGNNVAIRYILREGKAAYVIILNNDTVVHSDFLRGLVMVMEKERQIGIASTLLLDLDGDLQTTRVQSAGADVSPWTGNVRHRWIGKDQTSVPDRPFDVAYAPGACLCVRTSTLERVGLFDERYRLYFEETDLCYRTRRAGERVVIVPTSVVWHRNVTTRWTPTKRYYVMRNRLWFQRAHCGILPYATTVLYWGMLKVPVQSIRLLARGRWKELIALYRGLWDGLSGSGPAGISASI